MNPTVLTVGDPLVALLPEAPVRSWLRDNSAVWEVTTAALRQYFVKRHTSPRFHEREVTAYQDVVPSLGWDRAPELIAADQNLAAIVISGLARAEKLIRAGESDNARLPISGLVGLNDTKVTTARRLSRHDDRLCCCDWPT